MGTQPHLGLISYFIFIVAFLSAPLFFNASLLFSLRIFHHTFHIFFCSIFTPLLCPQHLVHSSVPSPPSLLLFSHFFSPFIPRYVPHLNVLCSLSLSSVLSSTSLHLMCLLIAFSSCQSYPLLRFVHSRLSLFLSYLQAIGTRLGTLTSCRLKTIPYF